MGEQTLTMLTHGEAGAGKSYLTNTAPTPRLILDAEGRGKYLPGEKVVWDPFHEEPPQADGSWDTCIAIVPDFKTMGRVFQWLGSGQHPFVTVGVDSLMEVQKRLIDDVAGLDQLDQQQWGIVLRKLEKLVREYRDLVLQPSNPVRCVIFTVGSKDIGGKMRPLLQGQLANTVPYFVDIVGFLYTHFDPENRTITRHLLVQPTNTAVAKEGTGRLGVPVVDNPDMSEIFSKLNGHKTPGDPE